MLNNNTMSKSFDDFLVRLHDSERVLSLAKNKSSESVQQLSNIIMEALECNLTPSEADIAADILIGLSRKLETQIRSGLALRLSTVENMPLRLALYYANDVADVASVFIENSKALSDVDLYYIVEGQGKEHWAAAAKRESLSDEMINLLASKSDFKTSENLLGNDSINLPSKALSILKTFVEKNVSLVKAFVDRQEASEELLMQLYSVLNQEERKVIKASGKVDVKKLDSALQDTEADFANVTFGSINVTPEMIATAKELKAEGLLTIQKLIKALKAKQIGLFYALFSEYTSLPIEKLDDIFMEEQGKVLAAISKAFDFDKSIFVSFFIQTKKLRMQTTVKHNQLFSAMRNFSSIQQDAGKMLLARLVDTSKA